VKVSVYKGPSWPWSHGSWIYNYLCNQCLSPLMLCSNLDLGEVYNIIWSSLSVTCDRSMVSPVSSIKKTDRHDILVTEILLKVALNTIKQTVCRRILPTESTFAYNSILIYIYPWYIKIIEFNKLCFYYIICIAIKDM
jgi:hypothetical protein